MNKLDEIIDTSDRCRKALANYPATQDGAARWMADCLYELAKIVKERTTAPPKQVTEENCPKCGHWMKNGLCYATDCSYDTSKCPKCQSILTWQGNSFECSNCGQKGGRVTVSIAGSGGSVGGSTINTSSMTSGIIGNGTGGYTGSNPGCKLTSIGSGGSGGSGREAKIPKQQIDVFIKSDLWTKPSWAVEIGVILIHGGDRNPQRFIADTLPPKMDVIFRDDCVMFGNWLRSRSPDWEKSSEQMAIVISWPYSQSDFGDEIDSIIAKCKAEIVYKTQQFHTSDEFTPPDFDSLNRTAEQILADPKPGDEIVCYGGGGSLNAAAKDAAYGMTAEVIVDSPGGGGGSGGSVGLKMELSSCPGTITLSSGKTFSAHGGIIGISPDGNLHTGYDYSDFSDISDRFTFAERQEITKYMINLWQKFAIG